MHRDVAVAAASQRLRQGFPRFARHDRLGELVQAAQGQSRQPGESGELSEPGGAAVGLHAKLVDPTVERLEHGIYVPVVADLWEVMRRDDRLLVDQDDVRRLRYQIA